MSIWYLTDAARFGAEHEALRALAGRVEWLDLSAPRLDTSGRVSVALEIAVLDRAFKAELVYPHTFPFTPPSVLPTEREHWSGHQYGGGGELCLEWGADNWTPERTGADMVVSAERLLSGEGHVEGEVPAQVPSRHALTLGQDVRNKSFRFVITETAAAHLVALPPAASFRARLLWNDNDKQHQLAVVDIALGDEAAWTDPSAPRALWANNTLYPAKGFRLPKGMTAPLSASAPELRAFLEEHGCLLPVDDRPPGPDLLLLCGDDGARLIYFYKESDETFDFTPILAKAANRLPTAYQGLSAKSVGLVGCGSAGSKIANTLARAGVGRLVLVDDDVLLPENLVRNDLDWTVMGEHKVRGVARRADLAAPGVVVEPHIKRLAGQEASGVADGILHRLQGCDLIIDATADPEVFNLLSGVVAAAKKPFLWLEIFAGGIGGLVARSRPGLDPTPQLARVKIDAWCGDQGVPPPRPSRPYEADVDGEPLIADDADVAAIAAHAVRMALDMLVETEASAFPCSAYLIGLRPGWIFSQPFDTRAIDLGAPEVRAVAPPSKADVELICKMFVDLGAQTSNS